MSLYDMLRAAIMRLKMAGIDNPPLDARLLFCHALGIDRAQLLSQSQDILTDEEKQRIDTLITRREKREPVARIIGSREFWGLPFALNEATLEPRPDSETLIESTLKATQPRRNDDLRVLDLGTGTGCLLLALLHEYPNATGIGIDADPRAVEQAIKNAAALELDDRAIFRVGNWLEGTEEKFDIIVSNPPYIPANDIATLMPEVRDFDPMPALDGGTDGLNPYRVLIPQLRRFLYPRGLVVFEVGIGQATYVSDLLRMNSFAGITAHNDLGGVARCVLATLS